MISVAGTLQVGIQNADGEDQNGLAVPKSVKYKVVLRSSNSTPRHLHTRNENTYLHQDRVINAHSIREVTCEKLKCSPAGKR